MYEMLSEQYNNGLSRGVFAIMQLLDSLKLFNNLSADELKSIQLKVRKIIEKESK